MTSRRTALVASLALVLLGLTVSPAQAAAPTRLPGPQAQTLRASAPATTRPALRRDTTVVGGDPAATHYSTWDINYIGPWTVSAKAAFQRAVDQWSGIIHSAVTIRVDAQFADLGAGVLGSAGPDGIEKDPGLGDGVSWYPDALADALVGTDMAPGYPDIDAQFSSTEPAIYYGTDGNPPAGYIDFESVVLHELGHGLGFTGSSDYDSGTGKGTFGPNVLIYDRFLESAGGTSLLTLPNSSTTLGTAYQSPVFWKGANAKAANGNAHVALYAPSTWESGSSIAHMDESTFGTGDVNSLMTPYIGDQEVVHRPGPIVLGIFQDMGYTTTLDVPSKVTGLSGSAIAGQVDLTWTAPAENGSAITGYTVSYTDNGVGQPPLTATGTSTSVTGLNDGDTYVFTVAAVNAVGTGAASDPTPGLVPAPDTVAPTVSFGASPGVVKQATGALGFTGSDPGHPSATLTFRCGLDTAVALAACTSPYGFSGLSEGGHTLYVAAKDAAGNETDPPASLAFTVDATAPTASITSAPANPTASSALSFGFTGSDNNPGVTFLCQLDSGAVAACTSPAGYSGLSSAVHTFHVTAVDAAGNVSPTQTRAVRVDTAAPTVTANVLPVYTLAGTVGLRYSGSDAGSGVASYDVRYRRAPFNGPFGGFVTPWQHVTSTVETMAASKGYTYCFSVLARDRVGRISPWSPERCTATALDDRSLAASTGWTRGTSSLSYGSTVTSVAAVAKTLTRTSVQARRVYLVATTCQGCGTVGLYWNGTLLRSVSLNAASTSYKHVISIKDFGVARSGTLTIKTLNSGRTYIDGVALSRT